MLNEVPNNNDVKRVANNMLNEAPNINDTIHIGINVHLTAVGTQQFSMVTIYPSCRKTDLPETRGNDTITGKVRADRDKLCPSKEWRLYTQ